MAGKRKTEEEKMSKAKRRKIVKKKSKKNLRLKLVYEPIGKLEEWAKNPRINDEAAEKLCGLIETYGFINPIVASPDGIIRAGHTRIKSAKSLGYKELPVLYVPFESEKAAEMFALADNKSSEWADWDRDLLNEFFAKAPKAKIPELEKISGFSQIEIEEIRGENEIEEDEIAEPPKKAYSRKGDLWILGNHRVMCGDATSEKDVGRLMKGKKADMIFADPPYGVNFERGKFVGRKKQAKGEIYEPMANDKLTGDDLGTFISTSFLNIKPYTLGASIYVWSAPLLEGCFSLSALVFSGMKVQSQIIWNKSPHVIGRADYHWKHEICWYGWWDGERHNWYGERDKKTVWDVSKGKAKIHPTMKPTELAIIAMNNSSISGNIVLDPFLGSGTTLIAAEQLHRICYGMEIEPIYVDVTIKRWQQLTGKTPTLLRKGKKIKKSLLKRGKNG